MIKKRNILLIGLMLTSVFTGCSSTNTEVKVNSTPIVAKPVPNAQLKQTYLIKVNKIILDTAYSRSRIVEIESDFQRAIDVPELISSEIDKTNKNLIILENMPVYSEYKEPHIYLINALKYNLDWWNVDLKSANQKINILDNKTLSRERIIANDKAGVNIRKVFDMIPQVKK